MAEQTYFKDIPNTELGALTGKIGGNPYLDNLASLQIGYGTKVFRGDSNGIWLGATKWADAPFRVDMSGNVVATSADFSGAGYTKINIFRQDAIPTSISIGDLWFDSNDGNKMYRAASIGADQITAGEWELVASTTISIFAQDAVPTSLAVGDLWYDTNDNNKPYYADSIGANEITAGEWELINDLRAADALLKAGTTQNLTGDIQVGTGNVKIDGANKAIIITDGTEKVRLGKQADNSYGLLINNGKITVKDDTDATVIDAKGLVGSATFTSDIDYMSSDQSITGDNVFADLSGLSHSIVLTRTTPVLFFGMVAYRVGGVDISTAIRIIYNASYFPNESGWTYNVYYPDEANSTHRASFIALINLPSGTNTVKLQAARTTTDETLSILGLQENWRTNFGYLVLGK